MTTEEKELLSKFDEAIELAYQALDLAIEYSGGDSETAAVLESKTANLESKIAKLARSVK